MVAILGFQFGLYHVVAPLSFSRSYHLCFIIIILFLLLADQTFHRFSCADNLFVQKSRLLITLKSFPAFGTRLWNCLLPDWCKLTKRAFKRKIHKLFLTILEIEDCYVDAHSLILNLNTSNCYTT